MARLVTQNSNLPLCSQRRKSDPKTDYRNQFRLERTELRDREVETMTSVSEGRNCKKGWVEIKEIGSSLTFLDYINSGLVSQRARPTYKKYSF